MRKYLPMSNTEAWNNFLIHKNEPQFWGKHETASLLYQSLTLNMKSDKPCVAPKAHFILANVVGRP